MVNAYEAGFAKALECLLPDLDDTRMDLDQLKEKCWEEWGRFGVTDYDPRENKELVKTSSRGRGRPPSTPSPKKPEEGPHLAEKPYDPEFCRARFWNGGDGGQCWRNPCDGDDHCKGCGDRRDNPEKDYWGCFDECLGAESEHTKSGRSHKWKKMDADRAAAKISEKKENKLKEKKMAKMKKDAEKAAKEEAKAAKEEAKAAEKAAKDEAKAAEKAAKEVEKEAKAATEKEAKDAEKEADPIVKEDAEEDGNETEDILDEDAESLDDDDNDYKEDKPWPAFEKCSVEGYDLKWNRQTNQLIDPDDDEVMGMMVLKDGEWVPEIDVDEE